MRTILTEMFEKDKSKISLLLGKENCCKAAIRDLTKTGSILIFGDSGSGHTAFVQYMIMCLENKYDSRYLQFALIDTKGVDLSLFSRSKSLFKKTYFVQDKAIYGLQKVVRESVYRYHKMKEIGAKTIDEYNSSKDVLSGKLEPISYLVAFVDDALGELAKNKIGLVEEYLSQIKEYSKCSGVYVIALTSNPNVVTQKMLDNFDTQILFNLAEPERITNLKFSPKEILRLNNFEFIFSTPTETLKIKSYIG